MSEDQRLPVHRSPARPPAGSGGSSRIWSYRWGEGGNLTRLKDVGRAELGSENYSFDVRSEENLAAGLLVYQLPGSNALDVATAVRERMAETGE